MRRTYPTTGSAPGSQSSQYWSRLRQRYGPQRLRPAALIGEVDASIERLSAEPLSTHAVRNLRFFWFDGVFSTVSGNFYANFVTLFALAYGATNAQVGQLSAIGSLLAALALLPGAWVIGAVGKRKPIVMWAGAGISRMLLLVWAFMPFVVHQANAAIWAIIILNALIAFMGYFANPAWTSMVADIVPLAMRGRYFSNRNVVMSVMALGVVPLAGWLVTAGNRLPGLPMAGYQLVFLLAFATGMISTYSFGKIEERVDPAVSGRRPRLIETARMLKSSPGFLGFVSSAFVWNMGLQVAGPFFNVYLVSHLGADTTAVGLLTAVSSLAALLTQPWLGRLADRKGSLWMQAVFGMLIPLMPLGWLVVTAPWQVTFINIASGVWWAAYNLANFNLLLEMAPAEARADAAAFYQFVVVAAAVIGPLAGGYLADALGFKLIFVLSSALRWIGALAFLWLSVGPARRAAKGLHPAE
jgi:MFS family permease